MKISIDNNIKIKKGEAIVGDQYIVLSEVFSGLCIRTKENVDFGIAQRDCGIEVYIAGITIAISPNGGIVASASNGHKGEMIVIDEKHIREQAVRWAWSTARVAVDRSMDICTYDINKVIEQAEKELGEE